MKMMKNIIYKKSNFEYLTFNQMFELGYLNFYVIPRFKATTHFSHASHNYIQNFLSNCNTNKSAIFFDSYIQKDRDEIGFFVLPLITTKPQRGCTLKVPSFRSSEGHIPYETPPYTIEISSIDDIYYHISTQFRKVAVNLLSKKQFKNRLVRDYFKNLFDVEQICDKMVREIVSFAELDESCFSRMIEDDVFLFSEKRTDYLDIHTINTSFDGFQYHEGIHYAKYTGTYQSTGDIITFTPFMEDLMHNAIDKKGDIYFFENQEDALLFQNHCASRSDIAKKDNINNLFLYKNIKSYAQKIAGEFK